MERIIINEETISQKPAIELLEKEQANFKRAEERSDAEVANWSVAGKS